MTPEVVSAYEERFVHLERVAEQLAVYIQERLKCVPRIDRVHARAKSPRQFAAKAARGHEEGKPRYVDPLTQIQDQIGARVVVFYKSDAEEVAGRLELYFRPLERKEHLPESPWAFGYFGLHRILALPPDVIPRDLESTDVPRFFELQIKTLFEHAWSEASHDLAYKPLAELDEGQQRRFAYAAAQAWGADRVFGELWQELGDTDS